MPKDNCTLPDPPLGATEPKASWYCEGKRLLELIYSDPSSVSLIATAVAIDNCMFPKCRKIQGDTIRRYENSVIWMTMWLEAAQLISDYLHSAESPEYGLHEWLIPIGQMERNEQLDTISKLFEAYENNETIPKDILTKLETLVKAGHEAYVTGGLKDA